jgi:hypothetical protein
MNKQIYASERLSNEPRTFLLLHLVFYCICVSDQEKTVDLNVHMDCDGCEKRVRKAMSRLKGTINF